MARELWKTRTNTTTFTLLPREEQEKEQGSAVVSIALLDNDGNAIIYIHKHDRRRKDDQEFATYYESVYDRLQPPVELSAVNKRGKSITFTIDELSRVDEKVPLRTFLRAHIIDITPPFHVWNTNKKARTTSSD
jgi:hypothetical protein